jgi:hypothetical protein
VPHYGDHFDIRGSHLLDGLQVRIGAIVRILLTERNQTLDVRCDEMDAVHIRSLCAEVHIHKVVVVLQKVLRIFLQRLQLRGALSERRKEHAPQHVQVLDNRRHTGLRL